MKKSTSLLDLRFVVRADIPKALLGSVVTITPSVTFWLPPRRRNRRDPWRTLPVNPRHAPSDLLQIGVHPADDDYATVTVGILHLHCHRFAKHHIGKRLLGSLPKILGLLRGIDLGEPDPVLLPRQIENRNGIPIGDPIPLYTSRANV